MSRALFIYGTRDVRLAPFNLKEGREDEVLLDVASVGVCGSDLHYYKALLQGRRHRLGR